MQYSIETIQKLTENAELFFFMSRFYFFRAFRDIFWQQSSPTCHHNLFCLYFQISPFIFFSFWGTKTTFTCCGQVPMQYLNREAVVTRRNWHEAVLHVCVLLWYSIEVEVDVLGVLNSVAGIDTETAVYQRLNGSWPANKIKLTIRPRQKDFLKKCETLKSRFGANHLLWKWKIPHLIPHLNSTISFSIIFKFVSSICERNIQLNALCTRWAVQ